MIILPLGVGEASDPDERNSAMLVTHDGYEVLIDCGHSVPPALWRSRPDPNSVDAVLFTHHHPDHVFGLIPVLIALADEGREKPLDLVTTASGIALLKSLCEIGGVPHGGDSPFPIRWREAAEVRDLGPFRIERAPTTHSLPNLAIRFEADGNRFAYSGDGRPTAASLRLFAEADLLFHECYVADPAPELKFHADLAAIRAVAGPSRIGVYHIRKDQRAILRDRLTGDSRLFVIEAAVPIPLG